MVDWLLDIDFKEWITKFFQGFFNALTNGKPQEMAKEISTWLILNPPLTSGQLGPLQILVNSMLGLSFSIAVLMLIFNGGSIMRGRFRVPQETLSRSGRALFLLLFYRLFVGWAIEFSNALTRGILDLSTGPDTPQLSEMLIATAGPNPMVTSVAGIGAIFILAFIGVIRIISYVFMLLLYIAGPLLIVFSMLQQAEEYFDQWLRTFIRFLSWPVVWAIEIKLFAVVLTMGFGILDTSGAFFAPFASIGMLLVMAMTPQKIPGPGYSAAASTARSGASAAGKMVVTRAAAASGWGAAALAGSKAAGTATRAAGSAASAPTTTTGGGSSASGPASQTVARGPGRRRTAQRTIDGGAAPATRTP